MPNLSLNADALRRRAGELGSLGSKRLPIWTPAMKTALLIIDVQQGLCEGEHSAFESADSSEALQIGA